MADVIDINANKPHWTGHVKCSACGHEWIAVAPEGTHFCECPTCHEVAGSTFLSRELLLIRALEQIATGRAPNESAATNWSVAKSIATHALQSVGWPTADNTKN
jgi:hypothetical protein